MLAAEIRGHSMVSIRDDEDLLTSCVFGHLRYLSPQTVWDKFLSSARGVRDGQSGESLVEALKRELGLSDVTIGMYESVRVLFWRRHRTGDEPDLLIVFSGGLKRSLVLLVEVKLWAKKSGHGEFDQLSRYLKLLRGLPGFRMDVGDVPCAFVVYLTPRYAHAEIEESSRELHGDAGVRDKILGVQWQDLLVACRRSEPRNTIERMVVEDIAALLVRRGLEYFDGMLHIPNLPRFDPGSARFYVSGIRHCFMGFSFV